MCLKTLFEHMIKAKHITRIAYKQPPEKGDPGASGAIEGPPNGLETYNTIPGPPGKSIKILFYTMGHTINASKRT